MHTCVRAALDVVCEPSAGVIGFTADDIQRIYPEGIPNWIDTWFQQDQEPGEDPKPRISQMEPDTHLWL